jgi:hypothetical protein
MNFRNLVHNNISLVPTIFHIIMVCVLFHLSLCFVVTVITFIVIENFKSLRTPFQFPQLLGSVSLSFRLYYYPYFYFPYTILIFITYVIGLFTGYYQTMNCVHSNVFVSKISKYFPCCKTNSSFNEFILLLFCESLIFMFTIFYLRISIIYIYSRPPIPLPILIIFVGMYSILCVPLIFFIGKKLGKSIISKQF